MICTPYECILPFSDQRLFIYYYVIRFPDQSESRFQAGSRNAKVSNKFKQYGNTVRSGIEFSKHNETCVKFDQNSDSSAIFRKVFSVDGVGLECHCSISSFKCSTDNNK